MDEKDWGFEGEGEWFGGDDLLKWEIDLKKAAEDPEMYERIRKIAQRRFLQRNKAENNGVCNREDPNDVDENTRRLDCDNIEGEDGNGEDNRDVEGVGCLEDDGIDKVNEQHAAEEELTVGTQELEHEPSLVKGDNKMAARELKKDYLLKPNNAMDHSIDVTPRPSRATRSRTRLKLHRRGYGRSWKNIKNANRTILAKRTEVDLKDKWRNLPDSQENAPSPASIPM